MKAKEMDIMIDWIEQRFRGHLKVAPKTVVQLIYQMDEDVTNLLSLAAVAELGGRKRRQDRIAARLS